MSLAILIELFDCVKYHMHIIFLRNHIKFNIIILFCHIGFHNFNLKKNAKNNLRSNFVLFSLLFKILLCSRHLFILKYIKKISQRLQTVTQFII